MNQHYSVTMSSLSFPDTHRARMSYRTYFSLFSCISSLKAHQILLFKYLTLICNEFLILLVSFLSDGNQRTIVTYRNIDFIRSQMKSVFQVPSHQKRISLFRVSISPQIHSFCKFCWHKICQVGLSYLLHATVLSVQYLFVFSNHMVFKQQFLMQHTCRSLIYMMKISALDIPHLIAIVCKGKWILPLLLYHRPYSSSIKDP